MLNMHSSYHVSLRFRYKTHFPNSLPAFASVGSVPPEGAAEWAPKDTSPNLCMSKDTFGDQPAAKASYLYR